jgi:adenine-specific DNA-methyltransferase
MDYLGNKAGVADHLVRLIGRAAPSGGEVADVFAGTGAVSLAFARAGYDVTASDVLPLSVTWTRARLLGGAAEFGGLRDVLGPLGDDPLGVVLGHLALLPGEDGWVTQNYSPASVALAGVERRYVTEANARRIDAIRHRLREWRPLLDDAEHALLMTCLLEAVSQVSNVAGTYGCYLKRWKASALRDLELCHYRDVAPPGMHRVELRDAETVAAETTADVIYADPPYTKRQYAAYYHLINSIATDEEPPLTGSTGLPDWRPLASDWCYKKRAPQALERLVAKSAAPVLALSYSSDGHIPDAVIRQIMATHGTVDVYEFERRRYRSSALPHKGAVLAERLYVMQR